MKFILVIVFAVLLSGCITLKVDKETEAILEGSQKTKTITKLDFVGHVDPVTYDVSGSVGIDTAAESTSMETAKGTAHSSADISSGFNGGIISGLIPGGSGTIEIILGLIALIFGKKKIAEFSQRLIKSKPGQLVAPKSEVNK